MADSLWMRLRKIPWDQFACNPGTEKKIPKMLENLASRKEARAMKASHELWGALCASGTIAPAAEPCVPFLFEILKIARPCVQSEILDILLKLAQSTPEENSSVKHPTLIAAIRQELPQAKKLTHSQDAIIADKAKKLLSDLG
jgi:hypothetical protein